MRPPFRVPGLRLVSSVGRYLGALGSRLLPEPREVRRAGSPWPGLEAADVLVAVAPPAHPPRARPGAWSWEWVNTVFQEVGPAAIAAPGALVPAGRRVVIVTRSCADHALDVPGLATWVEGGGILLAELPHPDLDGLAGLRVDPVPRRAGRIRRIAPALLPREAADRLEGFPVHAYAWKADPLPGAGAAPLLWIDDDPVLFGRRLGKGAVLGLALDHGGAVVSWLQGPPPPGFRIEERRGRVPGVIEPDDLVGHAGMLSNPVPGANLYQRAVMAAVRLFAPLPGWWPIPEGRPGACLLTHDDEREPGANLRPLIEEERRHGFEPSVFVVADAGVASRWPPPGDATASPDFHLHWNRYCLDGLRRHSVVEQRLDLERLGVSDPACRLHFLDWGREWDGPFQVLCGSGIRADSSLGPNRGWGYLFGSGLPYLVVDQEGLPFVVPAPGSGAGAEPLLEMPFHFQEDWGGITAADLEGMLRSAAVTDHVGVMGLLHAGRSIAEPRGHELWQGLMDTARELGLWTGSLSHWLAWHRHRMRRRLTSGWDPDHRRLRIRCEGPGVLHLPWEDRIRRIDGAESDGPLLPVEEGDVRELVIEYAS